MSEYKDMLYKKANDFKNILNRNDINAMILDDSIRDYSIKLNINSKEKNYGNIIVYYKPTKNSFSLQTNELKDKSIINILEKLWYEMDSNNNDKNDIKIFVDGAYVNNFVGYGVVIVKDNQVIKEISGYIENIDSMNQVVGELQAVIEAIDWCIQNSVKNISIYYDYEGIRAWANGEWKINNDFVRNYVSKVKNSGIDIDWIKVDSHTGNIYNEKADKLAYNAIYNLESDSINNNSIKELVEFTLSFIKYLYENGIRGEYDNVYNNQFARIIIKEENIIIDIYNSKKSTFKLIFNKCENDEIRLKIQNLYNSFLLSFYFT